MIHTRVSIPKNKIEFAIWCLTCTWMNRCECMPAMGMIQIQRRRRQQFAVVLFASPAIFHSLKTTSTNSIEYERNRKKEEEKNRFFFIILNIHKNVFIHSQIREKNM